MNSRRVFIGWDSREVDAYNVCVESLRRTSADIEIHPIKKDEIAAFNREEKNVSTEFAYSRFLTPYLSGYEGWSLFVDCDFLFTRDVNELFDLADDEYAVMCAQHDYTPKASIKMDGQKQVAYPKKNWSSCVLWNCGHPANTIITPEVVNAESGAFLHRFYWLPDALIGELPLEWNWLEGEYEKTDIPPAAIHFTNGGPWFDNCKDVDYADMWLKIHREIQQ
jgi:lipopolysaccharide biosynthesis glycosyltransferase